jgi:hypothetical protein
MAPIVDFETYMGEAVDIIANGWDFYFNSDETMLGAVYSGAYALGNEPENGAGYTLQFIDGASGWALQGAHTNALDWGGGIGFYASCFDASAFTGISLSVSGQSATGAASFSLSTAEGDFSQEFLLSEAWTTVQLPFASFVSDTAGLTTNGANIGGYAVRVNNTYVEEPVGSMTFVPVPAPYSIAIDNVAFY